MNVRLVQISDLAMPFESGNPVRDYYLSVDGLKFSGVHHEVYGLTTRHWLETPTWMAVFSGWLLHKYNVCVDVCVDVNTYPDYWLGEPHEDDENTYFLFSAMDANKQFVKHLVDRLGKRYLCIVGGYVDPTYFKNSPGTTYLTDASQLKTFFPNIDFNKPPNYSPFSSMGKTLPRITLSEGCLYDCAFCTIARKLTTRSFEDVMQQARSFVDLEFDYAYVDDKTYGQAPNWQWLLAADIEIRHYNPSFKGFIVQTTAVDLLKANLNLWYKCGVRVIEVGVETVDDRLLKAVNKPYRTHTLEKVCEKLEKDGRFMFVPNIIFGIPEDDYRGTIEWVFRWKHIIQFINPYVLCDYHDSKHGGYGDGSDTNQIELSVGRSWLSPDDVDNANKTMVYLLNLFGTFKGFKLPKGE